MSSSYRAAQCQFDIHQAKDHVVIYLNGMLHPTACKQLRAQVIPQTLTLNLPLVIDLSGITRIVSNLLIQLLAIKNELSDDAKISIVCPDSTEIYDLLFWSEIKSFFNIYSTLDIYKVERLETHTVI